MEILDEAPETELKPNEGKNKLLTYLNLGLFVVCIGILGISLIMGFDKYNDYAIKGLEFYFVLGIYLLFKKSSFTKSPYYKYSVASLGLIFIGALFKTMHWPGSSFAFKLGGCGGYILIGLFYSLYFISKNEKHWSDYVKLGFCYSLVGLKFLGAIRLINSNQLQILEIFSNLTLAVLLIESVIKFNRD